MITINQKKFLFNKIAPLPVLVLILFFSLAVRFSESVEQGKIIFSKETVSFAQAVAQGTEETTDTVENFVDDVFNIPSMMDKNVLNESDFSSSEIEILQSLVQRREALRQQEMRLNQREALIAAAERQLETKIQELNALRAEIEQLLGKQQEEQQARIKSLVRMYENMKPKDAARIFDTLEEDVLLSVVSHMSERRVAPILASMDAEKARMITIKLAEQKKLPQLPE